MWPLGDSKVPQLGSHELFPMLGISTSSINKNQLYSLLIKKDLQLKYQHYYSSYYKISLTGKSGRVNRKEKNERKSQMFRFTLHYITD